MACLTQFRFNTIIPDCCEHDFMNENLTTRCDVDLIMISFEGDMYRVSKIKLAQIDIDLKH